MALDTTVSDQQGASDTMASEAEFPVSVDTLAIDGTSPDVGDAVDVKVSGIVTRVVNGVAFLRPETVNDQPMPTPPIKPAEGVDEGDRLRQMSQSVDMEGPTAY